MGEKKRDSCVERQIDKETDQPSPMIDILLTLSVLAVGIFLVLVI
jgi:hypothetical protein